MKQFKLSIELVPKPLWYKNLRKMMGQTQWDRVRQQTYAEYGYRCGICATEGRLEAHEIWEYDDERLVQKLKGFIALCARCHQVKHIGLAGIHAAEGKVDYKAVRVHFIEVNRCTTEDFYQHMKDAFEVWEFRSKQVGWTVDWGPFEGLVNDA